MASSSKKVLVPVANGCEPIEAVITIDVLRRAGADVTVASVEKHLHVEASYGAKIVADALITDCTDKIYDLIAVPSGLHGANIARGSEVLKNMVIKQVVDGRLCAAISASPAAALMSWGLLENVELPAAAAATAFESRVRQDGHVVTSRGPGAAMEYAVALVKQLYGREKANEVAAPMVMRSNHGGEYTISELNATEWKVDNRPQINALVPIANGTEEIEAVIIIDVLRRAKINVVVASLEDKLEIVASRNVKLVADLHLDEAANNSYDLIILPGGFGGAQAFVNSEKLLSMLRKQEESNKPYGAICASPALVLEPHGLLKGKKATAFPALCNKLSDPSEAEKRVVIDGNLITSRGPGTTMGFALGIVEKLFGRKNALELARTMVFTHNFLKSNL